MAIHTPSPLGIRMCENDLRFANSMHPLLWDNKKTKQRDTGRRGEGCWEEGRQQIQFGLEVPSEVAFVSTGSLVWSALCFLHHEEGIGVWRCREQTQKMLSNSSLSDLVWYYSLKTNIPLYFLHYTMIYFTYQCIWSFSDRHYNVYRLSIILYPSSSATWHSMGFTRRRHYE